MEKFLNKNLGGFIKKELPFLLPVIRPIRNRLLMLRYRNLSTEAVFTEIYQKQRWYQSHHPLGSGSDLVNKETTCSKLPKLFRELQVSSLLDIPCGDFNFKEVNLDFLSYTGADIVEDIIQQNNTKYAKKNKKFVKLDIIRDLLPKVDLVLCRDLFIHFSIDNIFKSITNIKKSGSRYLLTTSHISRKENHNIVTGLAHPVNLLVPPFNFPEPLKIINDENSYYPECWDKRLLLFKIVDL